MKEAAVQKTTKAQILDYYNQALKRCVDAFSQLDEKEWSKKASDHWTAKEHLGHIVALFQMRGEDKQPMFEILGPKEHIRVVKQYMDETKKRVNPDSGLAVLQDMGL